MLVKALYVAIIWFALSLSFVLGTWWASRYKNYDLDQMYVRGYKDGWEAYPHGGPDPNE